MPRCGRHLEFTLLLAAQPKFLADQIDAMDAALDAVIGEIALQPLRSARLTPDMGGLYLSPGSFLCPHRQG